MAGAGLIHLRPQLQRRCVVAEVGNDIAPTYRANDREGLPVDFKHKNVVANVLEQGRVLWRRWVIRGQ